MAALKSASRPSDGLRPQPAGSHTASRCSRPAHRPTRRTQRPDPSWCPPSSWNRPAAPDAHTTSAALGGMLTRLPEDTTSLGNRSGCLSRDGCRRRHISNNDIRVRHQEPVKSGPSRPVPSRCLSPAIAVYRCLGYLRMRPLPSRYERRQEVTAGSTGGFAFRCRASDMHGW